MHLDPLLNYSVVADLATNTKTVSPQKILTTALAVLHPDVFWDGMGAQKMHPKEVFTTFLKRVFHVKTKWNSLKILQKQNSFQETQMCFRKDIKYWTVLHPHTPWWEDFMFKTINRLTLRKQHPQKISGCSFYEKRIFQVKWYFRKYANFFPCVSEWNK